MVGMRVLGVFKAKVTQTRMTGISSRVFLSIKEYLAIVRGTLFIGIFLDNVDINRLF
jgi:hypothetical protein